MIRIIKWFFLNRIISMAALLVAALISALLCYDGLVLIKAIPAGPTSWHDYLNPGFKSGFGPGFNYMIFGIPLSLLYSGEFIFSFSRRPSRLVSSIAVIQILLVAFFIVATK